MDDATDPSQPVSPPVETRSSRGTFASLALPQYRFLVTGTALSQIASWMEEVARGWLVGSVLDGSPLQLGLIAAIRGFSQLLMSPFAGYLVDRLDRRRLAAFTQVVPAIDAVIIAVLIGTGNIAIWQLYPLVAISGVTQAINVPTRQVLVYDVVGGERIVNAIALNSVVANGSRVIAPAVGGIVIASVGIEASYYAQAVFFTLATGATFLLHPTTHAEAVRTPLFQSIREGFTYVRGDPTLARLVILNAIPNLLIYPYVSMMQPFAEDVLHVGSEGYGVLLTGVGIGSIPGGLIVAGMTGSNRKGLVMGIAACAYMACVVLFAASEVFALSLAILVVAGVGWSMMVTLNQTLLQINVEDAYRGRVLALYTMASGFTPFGNLAMGASADNFGVQNSVAVFALTGLMLAAMLGLGSARVRRL
jgi:MFS transporter, DHA1 family, staphyloferrin A biosynthesis exporter